MKTTLLQLTAGLALVEGLQNLLRRVALRVTLLQLMAGAALFLSGAAFAIAAHADEVTNRLEQAMHEEVLQNLRDGVERLHRQSLKDVYVAAEAIGTPGHSGHGDSIVDTEVAQTGFVLPVRTAR